MVNDQEDDDPWQCLVDPFLSQEEQDSLDPEASEQGEPEMEDEVTGTSDDQPEDMVEFLSVAIKKPMSADRRRKLVTKYPRPSLA